MGLLLLLAFDDRHAAKCTEDVHLAETGPSSAGVGDWLTTRRNIPKWFRRLDYLNNLLQTVKCDIKMRIKGHLRSLKVERRYTG